MKLGLFIILFVIIFGGSYIVTNKLNGTSAYVDETAQLVKDKMTKDQEQRLVKILDKMITFSQS